jgi:glucose-1-phosphate adenylyltransferase
LVMALPHMRYWNGLRTVRDYWQAHMDLLREPPVLDMQDLTGPVYRPPEPYPPTHIAARAVVSHSMLSEGCVLEGTVEHSVLSPGVHVAPGAVVRNSILMRDVSVQERAVVENAILDEDVVVGSQAHVGWIERHAPTCHLACPDRVIVVAHGAHIPDQAVVEPELS